MGDDGRSGAVRTTLTGKPIEYKHDNHTNMMMAETSGFGFGSAGANLLPPGYTDSSAVRIPIKLSDVPGFTPAEPYNEPVKQEKKSSFFGKLKGGSGGKRKESEIVVVRMSRGDYLKYWAKGEDGKFSPDVQEPPEGRAEWLRNAIELQKEWEKNDPLEQKRKSQSGFHFNSDSLANGISGIAS